MTSTSSITLGPLGTDPADRQQVADALIDDLVDLYDSGMRAPLPVAVRDGIRVARRARAPATSQAVP